MSQINKFCLIFCAIVFQSTFAAFSPFGYLHDASRDCQTEYQYYYKHIKADNSIAHDFKCEIRVREDPDFNNSLLFSFAKTRRLTPYPVRVVFNDDGKFNRTEFDVNENEFSYSTKKAILLSAQMDYRRVKEAKEDESFKTLLDGKTKNCNITVDVKLYNANQFKVEASRNFTECTGTEKYDDFPKYKTDSTKNWEIFFDEGKMTNFVMMAIKVHDVFPDKNVNIRSGFVYKKCKKVKEDWDTTLLMDDNETALFVPLLEK
ncbi:uncharacterized protein LOC134830849 [Culicoides brevitarsis]|uniref:uncharacterized protein LOC134830849 n=1 Tax=Culicoides brevitarsis TaxID=469753 RepID=UPI00307C4E39